METKVDDLTSAVPDPADFRTWVQDALAILGLSALSVGRALGLGKNTVGDFLSKPNRSIQLDTASKVAAHLRLEAATAGKVLPSMGGAHG